jgi:hypothetical protein
MGNSIFPFEIKLTQTLDLTIKPSKFVVLLTRWLKRCCLKKKCRRTDVLLQFPFRGNFLDLWNPISNLFSPHQQTFTPTRLYRMNTDIHPKILLKSERTDDGRRVLTIPHLEHVVLLWAKKIKKICIS